MSLPIMHSASKEMSQMQTQWSTQINPLLRNKLLQGFILQNVQLSVGNNAINHRLGRDLEGYIIVRQRGPASIYDMQDSNAMPALTLVLNSSAAVSVDIYVF